MKVRELSSSFPEETFEPPLNCGGALPHRVIEPQKWLAEALAGLKEIFGPRLLYLGLQGSYRRGEASESSDIDLVTILDAVSLADLDAYRGVVRALPEGDKACGFICGAAELALWPRHELFGFKMDTADHYGRLADFMPAIERSDIARGVHIGASSLLHFLTHSYIYADPAARPEILKDAYKSAYFVILMASYLESGFYSPSKKDLLEKLSGAEREIVAAGLDFPAWLAEHQETCAFETLIGWCRQALAKAF